MPSRAFLVVAATFGDRENRRDPMPELYAIAFILGSFALLGLLVTGLNKL